MALRDFLLVFETSMEVESIEIGEDNPYAIKKNASTGQYFANFQFPEGVPTELAEQAFMRNLPSEDLRRKEYNLITDSLIYSITGFKQFKTLSQKLAVYGALNTPDGYIIDEDRCRNAQLFEEAFYGKKNLTPKIDGGMNVANLATLGNKQTLEVPEGIDAELLAKVLANPEMAALLSSLVGVMGGSK